MDASGLTAEENRQAFRLMTARQRRFDTAHALDQLLERYRQAVDDLRDEWEQALGESNVAYDDEITALDDASPVARAAVSEAGP